MELKIIKTEEEYEIALDRLNELFDSKQDTPEGNEAEILDLIIEKYEDEQCPIDPPYPIEAIKFNMDQMNLERKELEKFWATKPGFLKFFLKNENLT